MSDCATMTTPTDHITRPTVSSLGRDAILIAWDVPQSARFTSPKLSGDTDSISPLASLKLSRGDGGFRLLWVIRRPKHDPLDIELATGPVGLRTGVVVESDTMVPTVAADDLLEDLTDSSRVALISALFNVWSAMFSLQRNATFIRILNEILAQAAPHPGAASAVAVVADDLILLETAISKSFGKIDAIYILGSRGPERVKCRSHKTASGRGEREAVHVLAERDLVPAHGALLILIGPDGLSVRRLQQSATRLPSIEHWFRAHASTASGLRESLLSDIALRSASGRALALELQLRSPLKPIRVSSTLNTPSAEIVSALSTATGTLVTGWYRDPADLLAGVEFIDPVRGPRDLTNELHRFPVEVAGHKKGSRLQATGFAVLAPAAEISVPLLQPRFRLRLKSGSYHSLVPPVQPADPVEARASALRAVPPQHVNDSLLTDVLSPVIASLHTQARQRIGAPIVHEIGRPVARPRVSVIIPLYRTLEFLRFQIAAFATDPWLRANAEMIYVLDSPEQAQEVQHLLGGLHLIYRLPITLVVMERNAGYARANNAGVSQARGDVLALVNSDIIPTGPGWLEILTARLNGRRRIGAVGPKLLFEDDSIQHAGMYFSKDHRGRWLNQHFHKGMPRDYAPACEERLVPAVTGACLVTLRSVFEAVGGFTEDYVVGDYEDSDLCLKIAMTERKIAYVPDVELYHLERKSMSLNAEYMRGIAWQYNCALHTERWDSAMTATMHVSRQRKTRNAAI